MAMSDPVKPRGHGDQDEKGRKENGYGGDERTGQAVNHISHEGCRDHDRTRGKLPQDNAVQKRRTIHPGSDLDIS